MWLSLRINLLSLAKLQPWVQEKGAKWIELRNIKTFPSPLKIFWPRVYKHKRCLLVLINSSLTSSPIIKVSAVSVLFKYSQQLPPPSNITSSFWHITVWNQSCIIIIRLKMSFAGHQKIRPKSVMIMQSTIRACLLLQSILETSFGRYNIFSFKNIRIYLRVMELTVKMICQ